MISAGIDVGAVSTKAVILVDGEPRASAQTPTLGPEASAAAAFDTALARAGLRREDVRCVVATGRGRARVSFATRTVTEIAGAAAGAVRIWGPSVRTVLDAGGESCRVIHCTERGRATSFLWNDKCAAGIGRSLETLAGMINVDVTGIGELALRAGESPRLSDFCAVYALSELLDLVRSKVPAEQLVAAYHDAMARRISTLVGRAGVTKSFVIVGGLARNAGIVNRVDALLKMDRLAAKPDWDPVFTVALGAAVFAEGFSR